MLMKTFMTRKNGMSKYDTILDNAKRQLDLDEEHSIEVENTDTPHKKLVIKCYFDGTPKGLIKRLQEVFVDNNLTASISDGYKKEIKELEKYKNYYEIQQKLVNGEGIL